MASDVEPHRRWLSLFERRPWLLPLRSFRKEQLMICMYYVDNLNLKEIGLVLEVSESRVSQFMGSDCSIKGQVERLDLVN